MPISESSSYLFPFALVWSWAAFYISRRRRRPSKILWFKWTVVADRLINGHLTINYELFNWTVEEIHGKSDLFYSLSNVLIITHGHADTRYGVVAIYIVIIVIIMIIVCDALRCNRV